VDEALRSKLSLTKDEQQTLRRSIVASVEASQFDRAIGLLQILELTGDRHPVMLAMHAVCCAELGDDAQAREIWLLAKRTAAAIEGHPHLRDYMDRAESYLEGGPQHRVAREALERDATRFQPRSRKTRRPPCR
jgi:hypothetical protein